MCKLDRPALGEAALHAVKPPVQAVKHAPVFSYLEADPIFYIGKTAKAPGLSFNTVSSVVGRLTEAGILTQTEAVSRNRTFSYGAYLETLRNGT